MYRLELAGKSIQKQIDSLPADICKKIGEAISGLSSDPRPSGVRKTKGRLKGCWRIRVGSYRILFDINDKTETIIILDVGHRREIYRQ